MTNGDVRAAIEAAFCALEFERDKLAYLALTGKAEHPIRDQLAFRLHQQLGDGQLVAREWRRVDLAILDLAGDPVGLVELKAMYMADARVTPVFGAFLAAMTRDAKKCRELSKAPAFTLLLATHVHGRIGADARAVKYSGGVNRAFDALATGEAVRDEALGLIRDRLAGPAVRALEPIAAGQAFGLEVSVYGWLVGA